MKQLIIIILEVESILIIVRILLSWIPKLNKPEINDFLIMFTDPILKPIKKYMPRTGMFDFTPIIAILLIDVLIRIIYTL